MDASEVGLAVVARAPHEGGHVALLGLAATGWGTFRDSKEAQDGTPDPLDRWSVRVTTELAQAWGGEALFPFGGPPYHPFIRWASASGRVWPSAMGMAIHAERGLWISFRGAVALAEPMPAPEPGPSPCEGCASKPCLAACPVDAFAGGAYDVAACASHVASREGAACRERGCLARRACWVGQAWVPEPGRAAFHMAAFVEARR